MENYFWPGEVPLWNHIRNGEDVVPPTVSPPRFYDPISAVDDGPTGASRSHSEAEKRRRERINDRLATLRKLIPGSEKMDKAGLLGHVVEHVKELSTKAKECGNFSSFPSEIDEVAIDYINEGSRYKEDECVLIKASICCDDRPDLYAELNSAFNELGLTVVEGDVTSMGGRTKIIFVLYAQVQKPRTKGSLQQTLKLVLSRVAISSGTSSYCVRSKRQKFFYNDS